nr:hypothetical protein CFP56_64752 [Quercus suber]
MTAKHEDKDRGAHKIENKFQRRSGRQIKATSKAEEARKHGVVGLPESSVSSPPEMSRASLLQESSSRKMAPNRPSRAARPRQATNTIASTPRVSHARGFTLPTFSPDAFFIYYWPCPRPQIFPAISETYRAWKLAQDKFECETDIDDGADDWNEFAGNLIDYESTERFHFTIAGSFLARAKRAYRAGCTWATFEQGERRIDSSAKAKMMADPAARAKWVPEVLDNELRLAIFDVIAKRLCNEIWLEEYVVSQSSQGKRDSKVEVSSGQTRHAGHFDQSAAESALEQTPSYEDEFSERPKPTGWLQDKLLLWQPIYGDETNLPRGLDEARESSTVGMKGHDLTQ